MRGECMGKGFTINVIALFIAMLSLTGCLPDSESVRAAKLSKFAETQAAAYANALSSYSAQSQSALSQNSAFLQGAMPQGLVGTSDNGLMAYGYCQQPGTPVNHMMLVWYSTASRNGNFSVKGLGEGTGASIVHEMAKIAPPETIGYYANGRLELRGPRGNGDTTFALPSGCALSIPAGAPVILVENFMAPSTDTASIDTYVYKTLNCPGDDIGSITRRCLKSPSNSCPMDSDIGWEDYDTTCNGAVSARSVAISASSNSLIGALDIAPGKLQGTLDGLKDVKCLQVESTETVKDENGNPVEQKADIVNSCDTGDIAVVSYKGPDETVRNDTIESVERATFGCSGAPAGTTSGNINYGGTTYSGALNYGLWSGTATYYRYIYDAQANANDASSAHADSSQRGKWVGDTLSCNRPETFVGSCAAAFPQYSDTSRYQVVSAGGVIFQRTNQIEGWQNTSTMVPNAPLGRDAGWSFSSVSCAWDEVRTFNCPSGYTPAQIGNNLRRITVTAGDLHNPVVAEWRANVSLVCRSVAQETLSCNG